MEEHDFAQALEEATKEYMAGAEEAKGIGPLKADTLPPEVKQAMGLDMFPEDIQNDILALSQKIVEYVQALAAPEEDEEAKGPMGMPGSMGMPRPMGRPVSPYGGARQQPFGRNLINCWGEVQSGRIMFQSAKAGSAVARGTKNPALGIGAFGATAIGLTAKSIYNCMRR
jgi:hypothetical protein